MVVVNFDITTYLRENEFEAVGEDQSIVAEGEQGAEAAAQLRP